MDTARKITRTLFVAQALSSTAFLASATVTSIIGADLSGRAAWAGVPGAVYLLGTAASSFALGYAMDRFGRRTALMTAFAVGAVGAGIAGWAIVARTFGSFMVGLLLMGPASAAATLSRFVAAEVHPPQERGRAIANVVVGGTAGTVIWPLLSISLGPWLARLGFGDLTWPFLVCVTLLVLTSIVVAVFLRPDPRELARALADSDGTRAARTGATVSLRAILQRKGTLVAIGSMVCANAVMVMVMVITSLHMRNHQHSVRRFRSRFRCMCWECLLFRFSREDWPTKSAARR